MPISFEKIGQYLHYLSEVHGVQFCIKDFCGFVAINKQLDETLRPFLAHTNPFCMYMKSDQEHYIHKNPTAGCKLPKVVRPEIKPLEPEEIARMLKEAKKDAYDNLFIVAMFTGMRQGELLGLSWNNVNFKTGQITIKQQLQCKDGVYFLETPKSGKCRVRSPAPVVMEALKDEQQQQNTNKQIVGAAWENKFNLVFTDALGKNLVRRTVVKHFKAVIERANIPPDVRFHDLRHSFAVASLYSGDDVKTVQANLGHATAQFTLDVYGHVTQKMRQESAMRMQAFYNHLEV